jgi:hypothetical protein
VSEVVSFATPGVSIDGMDAFYASIDAATIPFDSRAFLGGKPTIGAFNTDNELSFFSGENLAATVETATLQLVPGYRSIVSEIAIVGDIDAEDRVPHRCRADPRHGAAAIGRRHKEGQ